MPSPTTIPLGTQFAVGADTTAPFIGLTAPASTATLPIPVTIIGTASDGSGIESVDIRLYNVNTGDYWSPTGFTSQETWLPATVDTLGFGEVTWRWYGPDNPFWIGVDWQLTARATDAQGLTSLTVVPLSTIVDTAVPTVVICLWAVAKTEVEPVVSMPSV